jgi:hypothetical protein
VRAPEIPAPDPMPMKRPLFALLSALSGLTLLAPARSLSGQIVDAGRAGGPGVVTLEGELSALSLDLGDERETLAGIGLRAMLHPFAGRPEDGPWWTRTQFGAFVAFTPERDEVETLHYGAEVDLHFVPAHRVARFDPFVALGVGGFRGRPAPLLLPPGDEELDTTTELALSPAIGMHVVLTPRFALRGDLRDIVVFGDETTHNAQIAAGVVLVFSLPDWSGGDPRAARD